MISLRFDGRVATSLTLPLNASGQLFALDGLLLARTFSDTGESGTSAFDLNTGALRWASRGAPALDKWIKTGDRWVITRAGATRQLGQLVTSSEIDPQSGQTGIRVIGFSNAHSDLYANEFLGELPGRVIFRSGGSVHPRGMLTAWALPTRRAWAEETRVDLKAQELGRTRAADGGLLVRMRLSNAGPNGAQQAVLLAALIEDLHRVTIASCTTSQASCPAIGAAPPLKLDFPAGSSVDIEFAISGSAASLINGFSRERLLVSLFPRAEELEVNFANNQSAALLFDGIFRDAFEN